MYDVFKDLIKVFADEQQTVLSANQAHELVKLLLNIDEKLDKLLERLDSEDDRKIAELKARIEETKAEIGVDNAVFKELTNSGWPWRAF